MTAASNSEARKRAAENAATEVVAAVADTPRDAVGALERVEAQLAKWDVLTKGETATTRTIRACIAGPGL
jgi:hypothetical protein